MEAKTKVLKMVNDINELKKQVNILEQDLEVYKKKGNDGLKDWCSSWIENTTNQIKLIRKQLRGSYEKKD